MSICAVLSQKYYSSKYVGVQKIDKCEVCTDDDTNHNGDKKPGVKGDPGQGEYEHQLLVDLHHLGHLLVNLLVDLHISLLVQHYL